MKKKTARSIGEISDIVNDARSEWKLDADKEIWFRGEGAKHVRTTLQPKLYRHLSSNVDIVPKNVLETEKFLHEEFSRCGTQLYGHDEVDEWDWYFLMQHYGAPTRLLDWSDGFLMAVHFAVKDCRDDSGGAFIYLLDSYSLNKEIGKLPEFELLKKEWKDYRKYRKENDKGWWPRPWDQVYLPGRSADSDRRRRRGDAMKNSPRKPELPMAPLVLEFPHITPRVAAQRSRFMVYGRGNTWLTSWAKRDAARIWRISIPKTSIRLILTQLRDAGVTESVIFPDLDGLGRELSQLWETLKKRRSS